MTTSGKYKKFEKINGTHPWRDVSPEGYVDYPVMYREGGRVLYFNFALAREMGLISKNHPSKMNAKLEEAILRTFSLQILNEHDWASRKTLPLDGLEDRLYMATRYLQLQHENKRGETSGDGRSIWNGMLRTKTKTFDISSRGTGTTILSPGVHEAGEHIPTGDQSYGYSSGLADLDEMLAGAIMAEVFYKEGIPTERCLVVIDYKDKTSVGVRTAPNLIRPAHFFRYLKSSMHKELKDSFDYFLKRQKENKAIGFSLKGRQRYYRSLDYITRTYAKLAALMEEEYIFNWLAWDGDNMLASGAILDYGSIRRFAAKHSKYRYEDVDRFSTCLTEQKYETRHIVQTFIQMIDYIITGHKRSLKEFDHDEHLKLFDECFNIERQKRMLWRVGFDKDQISYLIEHSAVQIENFQQVLNYFEHVKSAKGEMKVPDGVDHPPVFLIRHILRILPAFIVDHFIDDEWPVMDEEEFCKIMAASYVDRKDLTLTESRRQKARNFQKCYHELVESLNKDCKQVLRVLAKRSSVINHELRSTGDGLTWIVNEAIEAKEKMDRNKFQQAIDRFIESQALVPGVWNPIEPNELKGDTQKARLLRMTQENLELYKERI